MPTNNFDRRGRTCIAFATFHPASHAEMVGFSIPPTVALLSRFDLEVASLGSIDDVTFDSEPTSASKQGPSR